MTIDWKAFYKNRSEFPLEELARYAGQWIAWSLDGSSILASSAESEEAVWRLLEAAGHDSSDCCISYVPADEDIIEGPFILRRWARRLEEAPRASGGTSC
jgi:hypothetical protein